jgi:hypothetical protein
MTPEISALTLTRVGGLPADACDLVSPTTRALLAELAELAEVPAQLEAIAQRLVDVCFALVPRLDDDVPLRRAVLAGKRAVHQGKALPWDAARMRGVTDRLPAEQARLVHEWTRLTQARADLMTKLETQLTADREEGLARLRAALAAPEVKQSMTIAAPDWIRHADIAESSSRNVKTLYSYTSRAATKTSPFSGLTTVGVAGQVGQGRARSRSAAALALLALQRLARDEHTAHLLRYRAAPIRPGGPTEPGGLLVHGEVTIAGGVIWREDRVVEADHARRWLDALPAGELMVDEVLAHLGGPEPVARFRRLLDAGVLQVVPPWRQDEDPLPVLARLVNGCAASPITAADLQAAHLLGERAHEEDVDGRLTSLDGLARFAHGWADPVNGAPAPAALLYEDRECGIALPDPLAVSEVRADLESLGARMRPFVFRSHLYDLLVTEFVAVYGEGGACDDVLGFLMRLSVDRDANAPLQAAVAADMTARADPGERAFLQVGPTSAPPSAAVLCQLDADSLADVAAGEFRLVVNQFSAGSGALFTRFTRLLGDGFRDRLAAHVAASRPGVQVRELVIWTDCNTAQAECAGLLPALHLPGEPYARDVITLDDTILVHDATTDTLSLTDRLGNPIGLAYLGLIPQHMLHSYVRLLAVLADPWVNGSPHSDYTMTKAPELLARCGDEVVALPRITEGRLVTQRASWMVPVTRLPRPLPGRSDAELAAALDSFRRAHGLPEEVFVHQLGGAGYFSTIDRKPLWVSLASPLSATVLAQWLDADTSHVRMVEALPGRDRYPQMDEHGRRRVTEHAALLIWPKEGT